MSAISHTEYANVPPPAYSEAPADDLAVQLEQMKAMMEQMLLDKERLETEAKRRVDADAAASLQAKQEMEAAVKLQKEKKELDAVFKIFTDSTPGGIQGRKWSDGEWEFVGKKEIQFIRALEADGETLLLVHLDKSRYGNWDGVTKNLWSVSIILTNRHLYQLQYKQIHKLPASDEFYSSKLYSFANPLNLAQAKLLSSIMKVPKEDEYSLDAHSIWQRVSYGLRDGVRGATKMQSMKNFETICRLIPGGYKNGDWKQMDGFFGVYFNETTMEVSEVPPPSL